MNLTALFPLELTLNPNPMNTETFPDGSTIDTDENGNRTVFGSMAHKAYFERLSEERITSNAPEVAVVAFCKNPDGTRKAELIRRKNTNPITAQTFGPFGFEVWVESEPDKVTRYASEETARKAFRTAMVHGTNGVAA